MLLWHYIILTCVSFWIWWSIFNKYLNNKDTEIIWIKSLHFSGNFVDVSSLVCGYIHFKVKQLQSNRARDIALQFPYRVGKHEWLTVVSPDDYCQTLFTWLSTKVYGRFFWCIVKVYSFFPYRSWVFGTRMLLNVAIVKWEVNLFAKCTSLPGRTLQWQNDLATRKHMFNMKVLSLFGLKAIAYSKIKKETSTKMYTPFWIGFKRYGPYAHRKTFVILKINCFSYFPWKLCSRLSLFRKLVKSKGQGYVVNIFGTNDRSCHKECTCIKWKPYVFWLKSYSWG